MPKTKRNKLNKQSIKELQQFCTLHTSVLLQPDVRNALEIIFGNLEAINMEQFIQDNLPHLRAAIDHEKQKGETQWSNYSEDWEQWYTALSSGDIDLRAPKSVSWWLDSSRDELIEYVGTWG